MEIDLHFIKSAIREIVEKVLEEHDSDLKNTLQSIIDAPHPYNAHEYQSFVEVSKRIAQESVNKSSITNTINKLKF